MSGTTGATPPAGRGGLVASTAVGRGRAPRGLRRRLPTALVALGAVAAVAVAITGATAPLPVLRFVSPGHWVYSTVLKSAVHVDGATDSIDASVPVDAEPGAQVVQGESSGYVVGDRRITVFGKSDLDVEATLPAPADEVPLAVEGAGGPYVVYRHAGKVARLGERPVTIAAGGPVADPVLTEDGTMWLLRTDNGQVCELRPGADAVTSCPAGVPDRHTGALTLLSGQPGFVDTTTGELYPLGEHGFGAATKLAVPTGPGVRPAATDVAGRLAVLDPATHTLRLVDPKRPSAPPVTVRLPEGDYDGPAAGKSIVAVVDRKTHTVLTYDGHGEPRDHETIPADAGEPRLTRGDDDRVYVEGTRGTHVMVVGDDGAVADVPLNRAPAKPDPGKDKKKQGVPDTEVTSPPAAHPEHDTRSEEPEREPEREPRHEQPAPQQHRPERPEPPVVPASPPGAPGGVRAVAGSGSATVSWAAAADNGAAVTGYHLTWSSASGSGARDVGAGAREVTISGLDNGVSYTFRVAAANTAGRGAAASAKPVTPIGAAKAPTVTAIYDEGNGNAVVNWTVPDLGGGTLVHYQLDATGMARRTTSGTSMIVQNLPHDGRSVTFTVRAVTKSPDGQTVTGAAGSYTWPGDTSSRPAITISRGTPSCQDHPDEPTCAQMHVVMTGFESDKRYSITPHSNNSDYDAGDDHQRTDADGNVTFESFQYYWVGDEVWVSVDVDGTTIESNHLTWRAS